nr:Gp19/Gp15/Gp42 family protein [Bifidobacterium miconis]
MRRVCCAMVKRAMLNRDVAGVTQGTQTANGFTESYSYSNPDGDLYLTKSELRSLGCGVQRMWSIDLANGEAES